MRCISVRKSRLISAVYRSHVNYWMAEIITDRRMETRRIWYKSTSPHKIQHFIQKTNKQKKVKRNIARDHCTVMHVLSPLWSFILRSLSFRAPCCLLQTPSSGSFMRLPSRTLLEDPSPSTSRALSDFTRFYAARGTGAESWFQTKTHWHSLTMEDTSQIHAPNFAII